MKYLSLVALSFALFAFGGCAPQDNKTAENSDGTACTGTCKSNCDTYCSASGVESCIARNSLPFCTCNGMSQYTIAYGVCIQ